MREGNCSLWGSGENAKEELLERSSSLDSLQELSKGLFNNDFLKVLGVLRTLFQKGSKPPEAALPLPYKPKFEPEYTRSIIAQKTGQVKRKRLSVCVTESLFLG